MNPGIRHLLFILTLLLSSLVFSLLQVQWQPRAVSVQPWYIVETDGSADGLAAFLEDRGLEPVLGRGSVLLPISTFELQEPYTLASLEVRRQEQDVRVLPELPRLVDQFRSGDGAGELLFVAGSFEQLRRELRDYEGDYSIYYSQGSSPLYGLLFWGIIIIILLIFFDRWQQTVLIMIAFLPGYLAQTPVYVGLSILLCICLKDMISVLSTEFGRHVNLNPDSAIPVRGRLRFMIRRIRQYAPAPALWAVIIGCALCLYTIIRLNPVGLYIVPSLLILLHIVGSELSRTLLNVREQEHRLFFASHITPTWKTPRRKERVALLTMIVLAVSAPVMFPVGSSSTPVFSPLGNIGSDHDLTTLQNRVSSLLGARISGNPAAAPAADLDDAPDLDDDADPDPAPSPSPDTQPDIVEILLTDRAYQQLFPYLSLSITSEGGAGRYEDGVVYLTRYTQDGTTLNAYEEEVFELTKEWLISELKSASGQDMLRLYTDGEKWYNISITSSARIPSRKWSLLLEVFFLIILGLPWIGRWYFTPVQKFMSILSTKKRGGA